MGVFPLPLGLLVLIVTGYKSMLPLLQNGYPLTAEQFRTTLGKSKPKGKGKTKGKGDPKGKAPRVERRGGPPLLVETPTETNGGLLEFDGIKQRCPELWERGLVRIDTIDSTQGGEADFVIFNTTRSNSEHTWGFMDSARRVNVAFT